jgi:D-3-phosphoglycerate dehydrogenase / 2-oxoglutarate reductase
VRLRPRLLILNPTCLEVLEAHRAHLDASGLDWSGVPSFSALQESQIDSVLEGADALILPSSIRDLPRSEHMLRHQTLKVLSIAASGYDWLDIGAATANGIVVTNAPVKEGVEVVADMTWALLLAVARQIPHFHQLICAGNHERGMGVAVWQKTLGIVGLGQIGRAVARRAAGFEMRVLATEPQPDSAFVAKHGIRLVPLEQLLKESDFVSLHVRLDPGTHGMIGAPELALMRPTAFLINAARQQLVDEAALTEALLQGRLAGAGLDDPPTQSGRPLRSHPGLVFAPHHGNRAIEGVHAVFRCAIDNAVAVLAGRRPEWTVNPAVYAKRFRAAATPWEPSS